MAVTIACWPLFRWRRHPIEYYETLIFMRLSWPRLFQQRQGLPLRLALGFGSWADRLQALAEFVPPCQFSTAALGGNGIMQHVETAVTWCAHGHLVLKKQNIYKN